MVCEHCGREIPETAWKFATVTGGTICLGCHAVYRTCAHCGRDYPVGEAYNNQHFCPECVEHYWRCGTCGKICERGTVLSTDAISSASGDIVEVCDRCIADPEMVRLCDVCHSRYTPLSVSSAQRSRHNYCPVCHDVYGWDECTECRMAARHLANGLCRICNDRNRVFAIHEHFYVPDPLVFHQLDAEDLQRNPYLGFELEVDCDTGRDDIDALAYAVTDQGFCWCKSDGSLDHGFEIVSHPMTLGYHKRYSWAERLHFLLQHDMKSRSINTCGMHVHVNRNLLSEHTWHALDDWVSDHQELVIAIAQRHSEEYAKFQSDMSEEELEEAREGTYRYVAVNFENDDTIEFRVFRGTLSPSTLYVNLEFVDALVRMFKFEGSQPSYHFVNFVHAQPRRYAELAAFLEIKKIGVKDA